MNRWRNRGGFTIIELTLVVALIAILAAVAIPRFSSVLMHSYEGSTKGNLGAIRSALTIYFGDTEGAAPSTLSALVPKYINKIPDANIPAHQ